MKASALALALSCLLSQFLSVGAAEAEQFVSETQSSAGTISVNSGLRSPSFADLRRSRTLSNEACSLLNQAQYELAESKLLQALALEPNLASAHCNLGLLLNKTGRPQEAIPHLEYARRQAPDAEAPLVTLAASYQLCGDLSKAISLYSQYIQEFPNASDRAVIADIVAHLQKEMARKDDSNLAANNLHWTKKQLKVFVHTADGVTGFRPEFNQMLQESFLSWTTTGTLSLEFVNDATQADIEVIWTDDVTKLGSVGEGGEAVLKHRGPLITHATLTLLTCRPASRQAKLSNGEIKTLCLHEIGHALGLMQHSHHPDDVMYCTLTSAANPSQHDLSQLALLYQ
jgi:tetratricopeptide (TPR) repeat protein